MRAFRIGRCLTRTLIAILVAIGLSIAIGDGYFIWKYDADFNDVPFMTANGEVSDWPTGERPLHTYVPAFAYAFPFLFGAAMLCLWTEPRSRQ